MEGREANLPMIEDLKKSAKKYGWGFKALGKINSDKIARIDFADIPLDYVIFRELSWNDYTEAERVMDYLRQNSTIGLNLNVAGGRVSTSDKHYQQGLFFLDPVLKEHALPTFRAKHKANVMSYVNGKRVDFPFILKHHRGTTGDDITLIHSEKELEDFEHFELMVIEQDVEADYDWRVFVIGGAAVGAMRKSGNPDEPENFKKWCAGYTKTHEEDESVLEAINKIACRAAAISGLNYAGVDIIRDKNTGKYYLLETNIAAGWKNFVEPTGINIPDLVMDWFSDMAKGQTLPINKAVKLYVENRKQYLSRKTRENYEKILNGEKGIAKKCRKYFKFERAKYLYDAGLIFKKLAAAYEDLTESKKPKNYQALIEEIEQMPLSWAGNFIGPEVGTLEEGAILSALYLFILGKTNKV
ncbi:hypothetical protein IJJ49_00875 [Candidatus Saccharibacteria bacterium]|nr:hypothetical protein [Candidatus Saccharibacteria bacterium]